MWFQTNNIDLHFIERDTNIRVPRLHRKRSFCYMVFLTNTFSLVKNYNAIQNKQKHCLNPVNDDASCCVAKSFVEYGSSQLSSLSICPVIDNEFRHNIIYKSKFGSTREEPS